MLILDVLIAEFLFALARLVPQYFVSTFFFRIVWRLLGLACRTALMLFAGSCSRLVSCWFLDFVPRCVVSVG